MPRDINEDADILAKTGLSRPILVKNWLTIWWSKCVVLYLDWGLMVWTSLALQIEGLTGISLTVRFLIGICIQWFLYLDSSILDECMYSVWYSSTCLSTQYNFCSSRKWAAGNSQSGDITLPSRFWDFNVVSSSEIVSSIGNVSKGKKWYWNATLLMKMVYCMPRP